MGRKAKRFFTALSMDGVQVLFGCEPNPKLVTTLIRSRLPYDHE